jgi:hypothetical protein
MENRELDPQSDLGTCWDALCELSTVTRYLTYALVIFKNRVIFIYIVKMHPFDTDVPHFPLILN